MTFQFQAAFRRAALVLLLAALFALIPLPSRAAPPAAQTAPVAATAKPAAPAMWRLTGGKSRIYLFGTMHVLPKGTVWQTTAMTAAMAETKVTVVEADVDSRYARETAASLAYEFGVNPSWQTLSGVLGAERFERLARVAKRYGVSPASLERMRPWLAALQVSYAAMNAVGFEGDLGVERTVLTAAKRDNDKVQALETVEAQIKALAKLDGNDMLANVDRTISEIDDVGGKMQPMLQAWRTGDTAALERLAMADLRNGSPALYRALLVDRNAAWTERIARWHAGEGTYFIAVGAAHLIGSDSVIAMLAKKGIKAERLQ
jgi:hypothetical protein